MHPARLPRKCTSAPTLASSQALMVTAGPVLSGPRGSRRARPRAVSTSASVVSPAPGPRGASHCNFSYLRPFPKVITWQRHLWSRTWQVHVGELQAHWQQEGLQWLSLGVHPAR